MSQSEGEKWWRPVTYAVFYAKVGLPCFTLLWLKPDDQCIVSQAVLRDNFWANSYLLKARMKCLAFLFSVVLFAVFMAYTSAMRMTAAPSTYVMPAPSMNATSVAAATSASATHAAPESSTTAPTSSAVNFAPSVLAMAVSLLFGSVFHVWPHEMPWDTSAMSCL